MKNLIVIPLLLISVLQLVGCSSHAITVDEFPEELNGMLAPAEVEFADDDAQEQSENIIFGENISQQSINAFHQALVGLYKIHPAFSEIQLNVYQSNSFDMPFVAIYTWGNGHNFFAHRAFLQGVVPCPSQNLAGFDIPCTYNAILFLRFAEVYLGTDDKKKIQSFIDQLRDSQCVFSKWWGDLPFIDAWMQIK